MLPRQITEEIGTPVAFLNAKTFLRVMQQCRAYLTIQEMKTLRGQALNGDLEGAYKGLEKLLRRGGYGGRYTKHD